MKQTDCSHCGRNAIPVNDTLKIDGNLLCQPCIESLYPGQDSLKGKTVERELDATVCAWCSKDNGEDELPKISVYPVCETCASDIKNRTMPLWVKGFFVAVVCLTVFGFVWNWRFFEAYSQMNESNDAAANGDYKKAREMITAVGRNVPEIEDYKVIASYYHGIELIQKDSNAAAITELNKCVNVMPPDFEVRTLLAQARIGYTFDNKDYQGFLDSAKEYLEYSKQTSQSWASVASAYACLYAQSGKDSLKALSTEYLDKALAIDSTSEESKLYRNRIEHRLATREIITHDEFLKKYPNGWTKP